MAKPKLMADWYQTPESKRRMAESIGTFDPALAARWNASAAAQECGRLDDFQTALHAWEAAKPNPIDFVPDDVRAALEEQDAALRAKARALRRMEAE